MAKSKITKLFEKNAETQETIFHEIAKAGALQLLRRFRDNVKEPIAHHLQEKDRDGNLCIHTVVTTHQGATAIELLKALVELGANLNGLNDLTGSTTLHLGTKSNDYELAEWLVQHPQVDPNLKDWADLTASEIAFINGNYRMMELLRTNGARCPAPEVVEDWHSFQTL